HDRLLEQLRQTEGLDEDALRIGEEIIGSIDDTGYLRTHLADITIATGCDMAAAEAMLRLIQEFDPPGVGARDPRECLLLQLERRGKKGSLAWQAVAKHLDALAHNQIPRVAAALKITPTRVYDILAELRRLTPYPGTASDHAPDINTFITPEIRVTPDPAGGWRVESNREYRPRVRLSTSYLEMLDDPDTPAEVKTWLRQKLLESRQVLRALENREHTLERITHSLLKFQPDYFSSRGPGVLRPLTLDQVAQDLGLHETTISRAIAGKYLDSPGGVVPFRKFFATGIATQEGSKISSQSVKDRLAQLVREEDADQPLADQDLVRMLADQGFKLARRTVAKYREELNIPPSHLRRHYTSSG
ncbi:MAG: RNA polymerase factor sigma-54, partial [Lentisphaeria bacterium]